METDSAKKSIETALLSADKVTALKIFSELSINSNPVTVLEEIISPILYRIGEEWNKGNVSLAQVYMSGRICEDIVNTYLPVSFFSRDDRTNIAIAILNDYHVLGKRIVCTFLRSSGINLIDYGQALSVQDLASNVIRDNINILLISVLMLRSALEVEKLRKKLNESGSTVKLIVGGAPFLFDTALWQQVGADAMGKNASDAVALVKKMKD